MPGVVVDTHSIVWYLAQDPNLSATAMRALDGATQAGDSILVPAICLVELTYLVEKTRLPAVARERLIEALDNPEMPVQLAPLDRTVIDAVGSVNRSEVPDMPDRIVVATALALQPPLVTRDANIRASRIQTIW
ncbi:MAG: PIN domain-containing protein [Bryobacterales bacterium]|nr:PIN domain-containing protein [Bryobacterales bacterium]